MPSVAAQSVSCVLICGDDEYGVKQRARELFNQWSAEIGGMDHETIDAAAANSGEALKAIARLREGLQTLPFFGGGKVVWFQNCSFLGDDRTASAQAVTETLGALAQELKTFQWDNVRLIVSAGKIDKRKLFYKTLEKIGSVEAFVGWSADDRDWMSQAETWAARALRGLNKEISDESLASLVSNVGPNARQLGGEVEKLSLYVGDRPTINIADVDAVVTSNKQARSFALADALGDRNLPRLLKCLDEELWEVRRDSQRTEIGLLYGLISKVRALILSKEMINRKLIKAESDYNRFKAQLARVPTELLSEDKRFNPLAISPYMLFKAFTQARNYRQDELIRAMDSLLECNQKLVSRNLETSMVLQETLVGIVTRPAKEMARQPAGSPV
jgi:DNA polymerase III subunit delta